MLSPCASTSAMCTPEHCRLSACTVVCTSVFHQKEIFWRHSWLHLRLSRCSSPRCETVNVTFDPCASGRVRQPNTMSSSPPYSTPEEVLGALYSTSSTLPGPFQELNESFLLGSAYLVFFMHCGFAMVSLVKMLHSGCRSVRLDGLAVCSGRPDFLLACSFPSGV